MSVPVLDMYWIAEYTNGTTLAQFDYDTGQEHLFSELDHASLMRFGWYSFDSSMVTKIRGARLNTLLHRYTIDVNTGDELVAYKTMSITFSSSGRTLNHQAQGYILGIKGKPLMYISLDGMVKLK